VYKFQIPLQKGIELQPYQTYPVPIVRTYIHTDKLLRADELAKIGAKVDDILGRNTAQIQHWCNARRQQYSLSNNKFEKKFYFLDQLTLTHTIMFDQEIIEVNVYPEAQKKEQDELCLMIVAGNEIYAFPMSSLSAPATMTPIYKKQLSITNLSNDPGNGLNAGTGYKQYKFEGASIGFVLARVKFEIDRMEVNAQPHVTPVTPALNVSVSVPDNSTAALNGSNQDIYFQSGTYRYTGSAVTQIASTAFSPSSVIPYAIGSDGTYYFDLRSNTTTFNGHSYTLAGDYGYLTDAMNATDVAQYNLYGGNIWNGNINSPQGRTGYGTVPSDVLLYKYAYDFGFPYTISPGNDYVPDPPITDFGLTVKVPVFYTGSGDRIQLEDRVITADTEITWYTFSPSPGSTSRARDTTFSMSFGPYSYSKTDIGRDFGTSFNGTRPRLTISVLTKQPAANGVCFQVYRQSYYHQNWVGNYVDEDFTEYRLYDPTGLKLTKSTAINLAALGHASNGKSYLQAYSYSGTSGTVYNVLINGVDAYPRLNELEVPNPDEWQLAVMDVPLSRIKKFV
jgi:hypothetical protein